MEYFIDQNQYEGVDSQSTANICFNANACMLIALYFLIQINLISVQDKHKDMSMIFDLDLQLTRLQISVFN